MKCQWSVMIFLILSAVLIAYGQDKPEVKFPRNSILVTGSNLIYVGMYSLSYERIIHSGNYLKLAVDAGVGGWYFSKISKTYSGYSMPLYFSTLMGRKSHRFEINVGARYTFFGSHSSKDNDVSPWYPELNMGYRYQRLNGNGLLFRSFIGLSGVGIGIGKAF